MKLAFLDQNKTRPKGAEKQMAGVAWAHPSNGARQGGKGPLLNRKITALFENENKEKRNPSLLGLSGATWDPLGPTGGALGLAGPVWGRRGPFGAFWGRRGPSGAAGARGPLGALWGRLGPFGAAGASPDGKKPLFLIKKGLLF